MKSKSMNQTSSIVCLKNVFILTLLIVSVFSVQGQAFQKSDKLISPGIGLGLRSNSGIGPTIPLVINADIGILDFLSVGAYAGYWTREWNYMFAQTYRLNSTHLGLRASFHFWNLLEDAFELDLKSGELDVYVSIWSGYNARSKKIVSQKFEPDNFYTFRDRYQSGISMGVRYFPKDKFGIFAEFGGTPTSYSTIGVTLKL